MAGRFEIDRGSPVILYLQSPREKVWALLVSIGPAGVVVRGLDLMVFEDWMRQVARHEESGIGLTTVFYPMYRLERMERDETTGPLVSYAERFAHEVGCTVREAIGFDDES